MALNTQLVSLRLFLPLRQISHVCVENTTSSFPSSSPHVRRENTCFLVNLFLFVVTGANQKSSSHFHCLKCDYYCTDTNKVRRECIFCAYSLVLQCNIVTHVVRQQKVREGKRQRKDEDKLHFANWNWELKQISPGGGAQEAASKAGQHHGCRWAFSIIFLWVFDRHDFDLPLFRLWEVYPNAVLFDPRMQSQWETNSLPLQVNLINLQCPSILIVLATFPLSGSVSTLFLVSLKWKHTSTDISTNRRA